MALSGHSQKPRMVVSEPRPWCEAKFLVAKHHGVDILRPSIIILIGVGPWYELKQSKLLMVAKKSPFPCLLGT